MRGRLVILSTIVLWLTATGGLAGEDQAVAGVAFDTCRVFLLKQKGRKSAYTLYSEDGKLIKELVAESIRLNEVETNALAAVLSEYEKMGEDTEDCRFVPFAIVFYMKGKPVLQVFSNIAGGDLWTEPKTALGGRVPDDRQLGRMVRIAYGALARIARPD